jgi:predicted ArsR family transcriptional regulator
MNDTPARLLNLLSLLQIPRERPGSELAERLGVSPCTIRRDIDRLRGLGYPVRRPWAPRAATGRSRAPWTIPQTHPTDRSTRPAASSDP